MQVPHISWFKTQRKGLGYEAWLYAMVRVCTCETVLQWGFDESSIDGVPTLNQWVLLKEAGLAPSVTTIECAGILVGSTASEIADHIRESWVNGQSSVEMLREALGPFADVHVPIINGGVMLHKLQGVMHDTCHTATKRRAWHCNCGTLVGSCTTDTTSGSHFVWKISHGLIFCVRIMHRTYQWTSCLGCSKTTSTKNWARR